MKLRPIRSMIPVMAYGRAPLMIIIAGRLGVVLAGVLAVRLSTTFLSPAQLGSISQLNSVASFCSLLFVSPVIHFMNRGFLEWYDTGILKQNAKKYLYYLAAISIIAALASGASQWKWDLVRGFGVAGVIVLIGLISFFQSAYTFGNSGLNLFGDRSWFVVFSNLVAWGTILFSWVFFVWQPGVLSWSFGQVVAFLLGSLSLLALWRRMKQVPKISHTHRHTLDLNYHAVFRFSWPIMVTSLLWWVQSQSYRFILDKIQGIEQVGLFTVAYSLAAMPIAIYESVIGQYLDPVFFGDLKHKDQAGQVVAWNKYASLYLPGLLLVGIFIASSAPFLTRLLLGEHFREGAFQITLWAAVIETMRATSSLMFHLGIAKADNRMLMIGAAAGAILAPIGILSFGRIDPVYGTIAGLLLAGIIVLAINIRLSYKVLPVTWPLKKVMTTFLLGAPLIIILPMVHYYKPGFNLFFSIVVLSFASVYTAAILGWMLMKKNNEA